MKVKIKKNLVKRFNSIMIAFAILNLIGILFGQKSYAAISFPLAAADGVLALLSISMAGIPLIIINVIKSIKIYIKEKPDVVITTGVLSMIPISIIAKICRKKLIYIESFAIVNKPTLTGRLLYKFADRFYVQWESMLKVYKKAIFLGGLY